MRRTDYIPSKDWDFLRWMVTLLKYLMSRVTKFKVPQEEYDLLEQEKNIFAQKLEVATEPPTRTKVTIQEKNMAREVLKKHIRKFVKEYLIDNHLLTKADLELLGLPVHKTKPTPRPVAADFPWIRANTNLLRHVSFDYGSFDPDTAEPVKAKPFGQHGVEFGWVISDTPIIDTKDLIHSSFDTHTPLTLEFEGHDRGKTLWYAARWENTRGLKGPWSPMENVIIP
jgi:hypothetical protein